MIRRKPKPSWERRASGLYVPPFVGRLLPKPPMMQFAPWYPCHCPGATTVECMHCSDGVAPEEWKVVISGVANILCDCASLLNDIPLILRRDGYVPVPFLVAPGSACYWGWTVASYPDPICRLFGIGMAISGYEDDYFVTVGASTADWPYGHIAFVLSANEPFDCSSFNDTEVPLTSYHNYYCNWTNATCHLTSL